MIAGKQYIKSLSIPVIIYCVLALLIMSSRWFSFGSFFFEAVSIDLIITAPVLYYLAARKWKTRTALVFPIIALGFSLSQLLIPVETVTMQWLAKFLLPALELITLGSIAYYAYQFYQNAKQRHDTDALTIIRQSCEEMFGKNVVSAALATEIAMMYYAFFARQRSSNQASFSSYRENGTITLYGFFVFIILAETCIVHILLVRWNIWVAWILFASSVYIALQLFAHARALVIRKIEIGDTLKIRYGLAGDVTISYHQIESITISSKEPANVVAPVFISLLKPFETHSIIIKLKEEIEVISFYNRKKRGRTILLPVDEASAFAEKLRTKLIP